MSITSGEKVLASTWNSHIHNRTKDSLWQKSISGGSWIIPWHNINVHSTLYFWSRASGWSWPDLYNDTLDYAVSSTDYDDAGNLKPTIMPGDKLTYNILGHLIAFEAQTEYVHTPPDESSPLLWKAYRWEFPAKASFDLNDEVVYGSGLFKVKVPSTSASPVLPTYAEVAYSDPNYISISAPTVHFNIIPSFTGSSSYFKLYLLRPGQSSILVAQVTGGSMLEYVADGWLPPGKYQVDLYLLDDDFFNIQWIGGELTGIKYDDNVQSLDLVRSLKSDLSDLNPDRNYKLTSGNANSSPLLTGSSLDKKGGTSENYTGDW